MLIPEPRGTVLVDEPQLQRHVIEVPGAGEKVRDALAAARREKPIVRRQLGEVEFELMKRIDAYCWHSEIPEATEHRHDAMACRIEVGVHPLHVGVMFRRALEIRRGIG